MVIYLILANLKVNFWQVTHDNGRALNLIVVEYILDFSSEILDEMRKLSFSRLLRCLHQVECVHYCVYGVILSVLNQDTYLKFAFFSTYWLNLSRSSHASY